MTDIAQKQREHEHRMMLSLALVHLRRLKRRQAAYDEEVAAWYRSGDGRPPIHRVIVSDDGEVYHENWGGRGYRFPHCIHGTSLWTDYDNICGPCEDGASVYELALAAAHDDVRKYKQRLEVYRVARDANAPEEILSGLIDWMIDVLPHEWRNA